MRAAAHPTFLVSRSIPGSRDTGAMFIANGLVEMQMITIIATPYPPLRIHCESRCARVFRMPAASEEI